VDAVEAQRFLTTFGTVEGILTASKKELQRVSGIGRKIL